MDAETYKRRAASLFVALTTMIMITTRPAQAQSDNRVAAEALFQEARKLLESGQYSEACEKLASSQRLDPAVGTLINLAHCYEKLGRTATAWETYREAIASAKRGGQVAREKAARRAADQLEGVLPHLTIAISPQSDDAKPDITRDGVAIAPELWGTALPVDPGEHVISATASGRQAWTLKISLDPRMSKNVVVPPLEPSSARPPPEPAHTEAALQTPTDVQPLRTPEPATSGFVWNAQRTWAAIAGTVGLAGAAVAVVEYVNYANDKSQADSLCPGACQSSQYGQAVMHLDDARTEQTIAIAGAATGAAGLILGAVLWFSASDHTPVAPSGTGLRIEPLVTPRESGLRIAGAW